MTATEILKKLKQTFNELQKQGTEIPKTQDEKQNVKMMSSKLADGTEVEITDMVVGGIVTMNGSPVPVGEYTLEDGTKIVIGENGAITEIESATTETQEPVVPEDMAKKAQMNYQEEFSKFQTSTSQKFSTYEAKFASYEQKFSDYEARLTKATKVIEGLLNLTQTLAETPTGIVDESVKSSSSFSSEKEFSYDVLFSK